MKQSLFLYTLACCLVLFSCKKYLDEKPNKSLQTPTTIDAVQGILDYFPYMNRQCEQSSEIASDNYYLTDSLFGALSADRMRNAYLWKQHIFNGTHPDDWQNEYTVVYNANVVLESLEDIGRTSVNASAWDNCKGQALVFRAKAFYEIAQVWAKAYNPATAGADLGIPLRLASDFNIPSRRSTIKETYEQIINDLTAAIPLLPDKPVFVFRPSRPAAYALLARTYLVMGNYIEADHYANLALAIQNTLVDYNTLNPSLRYPFSPIQYTNPEDVMHSRSIGVSTNLSPSFGRIDSLLYRSYAVNDLRKVVFFKENTAGGYSFSGNYSGTISSTNYNGIATDELYLISAECKARLGDAKSAIDLLNKLLVTRWKKGTFVPFAASDPASALQLILTERRKELVYRCTRFSDIKRLNRDGANIILQRVIGGVKYMLSPNDSRYALPIPDEVITASGMQQNE